MPENTTPEHAVELHLGQPSWAELLHVLRIGIVVTLTKPGTFRVGVTRDDDGWVFRATQID